MKTLKYNYLKVIQQNYGYCGFEDVSEYEANSLGVVTQMSGQFKINRYGIKREISALTHDLREYRLLGYPTRVIFRKELNPLWQNQ